MLTISRWLLAGTALLMLAACSSNNKTTGPDELTVIVAVIDSLMPEDIDSTAMPNVSALIDQGTTYTESRSVFSAETIPNHVAMMTGVYPDRNGIPTNNFWDKDANPGTAEDEDLDNPNELTAKTLFTWIDDKCRNGGSTGNANIRTAAVLSKKYLYEIFRGDEADTQDNDAGIHNVAPDDHWDPTTHPLYIGPQSEHTIDVGTGEQALARLADADFMFINFGDVDRSSHASGQVARLATRTTADTQIGLLIQELQAQGRWDNTVMIIASDHGMDFSDPGNTMPILDGNLEFNDSLANSLSNSVSTQPLLDQLQNCGYEPMYAAQNGGTDSIYVANTDATTFSQQSSVGAARACLLNFDGDNSAADAPPSCASVVGPICKATLSKPTNISALRYAWYANPELYSGPGLKGAIASDTGGIMPASIKSRHENLGDLVLVMGDGFKFSEPDVSGNPIPGNHGHVDTLHNVTIVSGGADFLIQGQQVSVGSSDHLVRDSAQSENIDVAPTVAWLLGLGISDGDFPDADSSFPDYGDGGQRSGFDGRILREAFTTTLSPSECGRLP